MTANAPAGSSHITQNGTLSTVSATHQKAENIVFNAFIVHKLGYFEHQSPGR